MFFLIKIFCDNFNNRLKKVMFQKFCFIFVEFLILFIENVLIHKLLSSLYFFNIWREISISSSNIQYLFLYLP